MGSEKIKVPVTIQDPCNMVRSSKPAEKNRHLPEMLLEDFRPLKYQGNFSCCCGGGGGAMPMGGDMKKLRLAAGRVEAEQFRQTGAKLILVPCHNCID